MTKIENSRNMTSIIARKLCAENAADLYDSTLEKLLAPCVSGPKLVEFAKANKIFLCAEFMKIWANEHAPKYLWDMADYLAAQGWIFRSSISQVEWTQAGCDAWRAAFSAEFPEDKKPWEKMQPFKAYKVITKSGNFWITEIRAELNEARDYFLNQMRYHITEDFETGKETYDQITAVEEI